MSGLIKSLNVLKAQNAGFSYTNKKTRMFGVAKVDSHWRNGVGQSPVNAFLEGKSVDYIISKNQESIQNSWVNNIRPYV